MRNRATFKLFLFCVLLLFASASASGGDLESVLERITEVTKRQAGLTLARPSAYEISRRTSIIVPGQANRVQSSKLWLVLLNDGALMVDISPQDCALSLYNTDYGAYIARKGFITPNNMTDLKLSGYKISDCFGPRYKTRSTGIQ